MKKILVTGGAGYIGSHTVKELINNGFEVLVYDNLSSGHSKAINSKAKLVIGDISELDKLDSVFKKFNPDAVIHFAAFIEVPESVSNPGKYYYNNVCFGINILEMMAKYKVKNIIFSSSAAVYGNPKKIPISENDEKNPINAYGQTKLMFEQILDSYDVAYQIKSVCLRYFNAAGASADGEIGQDPKHFTHVIPIIIKTALGEFPEFTIYGNDYPTPDGTCIRDYIHVEDLANAHRLALNYLSKKNKSNVFNLGKGKGNSNLELVNCVKKISGVDFKVEYAPRRLGDPAKLIANPAKAIKELKWSPKYDNIESIIKTAYNWHKNHPKGFN